MQVLCPVHTILDSIIRGFRNLTAAISMRRAFSAYSGTAFTTVWLNLAWRWRVAIAIGMKGQSEVVFFQTFTPGPMIGERKAHWKLL